MTIIKINEKFCGPPGTGNGGYICGIVGGAVGSWPVEITLQKPVPLEVPLGIEKMETGAELRTGGESLARAHQASLDLDVPQPPKREEALEASKGFLGYHKLAHPYKRCFVCGPARAVGDGMRIFAGPLKSGRGAATVWSPEDYMEEKGEVKPEFVLGALDCPGYFSQFPDARQHALLGRMTADIIQPLRAGEEYIVFGWPIAEEGRKHFVGTALFDAAGTCVAKAKSIWFTVSS